MKRFLREYAPALLVLALGVSLGLIGTYNSAKYRERCEALGGVPVADEACVKPNSTIEVPR